jgi:hypothetical protein
MAAEKEKPAMVAATEAGEKTGIVYWRAPLDI